MKPNLADAQAFLTALDEESESFLFQTFDDTNAKDKRLTRQFFGSLKEHADVLTDLNARGAGIFVTVNENAGKGHKKSDIERIRALYVDLDGSPLEPVLASLPRPQIVVQTSPQRFHTYWRVVDCTLDEAEPALRQLIARYGGDTACCDRSRVLRLPGFYHRKAEPFLVHVWESSPGECRMADFEFSPNLQKSQKSQKTLQSSSVSSVSSVGDVVARYLPRVVGDRNRCLFDFARYVKGVRPDATTPERRALVKEWYRRALPVIGTVDFSVTWGDFERGWPAVRHPYGAKLALILEGMPTDGPVPTQVAELGYEGKSLYLVRICAQLQHGAAPDPFFLSAREAGKLIGMHFTDASKALFAMMADGLLELVTRGAGTKASRYRYVGPEFATVEDRKLPIDDELAA